MSDLNELIHGLNNLSGSSPDKFKASALGLSNRDDNIFGAVPDSSAAHRNDGGTDASLSSKSGHGRSLTCSISSHPNTNASQASDGFKDGIDADGLDLNALNARIRPDDDLDAQSGSFADAPISSAASQERPSMEWAHSRLKKNNVKTMAGFPLVDEEPYALADNEGLYGDGMFDEALMGEGTPENLPKAQNAQKSKGDGDFPVFKSSASVLAKSEERQNAPAPAKYSSSAEIPLLKSGDAFPKMKSASQNADLPKMKAPPVPQNADLPKMKAPPVPQNADLPKMKAPPVPQNDGFPQMKSSSIPPVPQNADLPKMKAPPLPQNDGFPQMKGGIFGPSKADGLPLMKNSAAAAKNDGFPQIKNGNASKPDSLPKMKDAPVASPSDGLPQIKPMRPVIHGAADIASNDSFPPRQRVDSFKNNDSAISDVPKLKFSDESKQPRLQAGRRPTGAFDESYDINNDSGLPVSDDPLSLLSDISGSSKNSKEDVGASDILGILGAMDGTGSADKNTGSFMDNPAPAPENLISPQSSAPNSSSQNHAPSSSQNHAPHTFNIPDPSLIPAPQEAPAENRPEETEQLFDLHEIKKNQSVHPESSQNIAKSPQNVKKSPKKRSSNKALLACTIAVVCAVLAIVAYNLFFSENDARKLPAVTDTAPKEIVLDWKLAAADQRSGYVAYYKKAVEKLQDNRISADEKLDIQGRILTLFSLASLRYGDEIEFKDNVEMLDASASKIAQSCSGGWCAFGLYAWGKIRNNDELGRFADMIPSDNPELSSLRGLADAAASFAEWEFHYQNYSEMKKSAEEVLEKLPKDDAFAAEYPIAAWIRASVLKRMGQWEEALKILDTAHPAEQQPRNPAADVLKAEILFALGKNKDAVQIADAVLSMPDISVGERSSAQRVKLLSEVSEVPWDSIEKKVYDIISNYQQNRNDLLTASAVCKRVNKVRECRSAFQTLLDKYPDDLYARQAYLYIMIEAQDWRKILSPLESIDSVTYDLISKVINDGLKIDASFKSYWVDKGIVDYFAGKMNEADKAFEEIERGKNLIWSGSVMRMAEQLTHGDAKKNEAINALRSYVDEVHNILDIKTLAGILEFAGLPEEMKKTAERGMQLHPYSTDMLNISFDAAVFRQDQAAAEKFAHDLEMRQALQPEHQYRLALLTEKLGDVNAALERMLTLIDKNQENSLYLSYAGELFFKQKHYDSALQYYTRVLAIDSSAEAMHYKGRCLFEMGNIEGALPELEAAHAQDVFNVMYHLWNGIALARTRQIDDAVQTFTALIDKWSNTDPGKRKADDIPFVANAFFERAELRKYQNRRLEAFDDYTNANEMAPDNPQYMAGFAVFLFENEKISEAMKYLEKVYLVQGNAMDAKLCFIKGLIHLKQNQRNDALKWLEAARDLGYAERSDSGIFGVREAAEVYERLGYLYRDLGKKNEARDALNAFIEKAKNLSPEAVRDVKRQIEKI